jgi:hypothetical protein
MKALVLASAAAAMLAAIAAASTPATAQLKGAACLDQCRADLKQRGLLTSYPYGYCRKKCDYWVGAKGDRR